MRKPSVGPKQLHALLHVHSVLTQYGLPFPLPGDLLGQGIKPVSLVSPALAGAFFTTSATWEAPTGNTPIHLVAQSRNQTGKLPPLSHCIHHQSCQFYTLGCLKHTYPIPPQPVAMLVQAITFYVDSCSYCPAGHPVSIVYSRQTISYILTRVNL